MNYLIFEDTKKQSFIDTMHRKMLEREIERRLKEAEKELSTIKEEYGNEE